MRPLLLVAIWLSTSTTALAHGMSEADKQRILDAGLLEFVDLGARHMLTGYDHLLFLFGVIFFLQSLQEMKRFVPLPAHF